MHQLFKRTTTTLLQKGFLTCPINQIILKTFNKKNFNNNNSNIS